MTGDRRLGSPTVRRYPETMTAVVVAHRGPQRGGVPDGAPRLRDLREATVRCIETLGTGFVAHPANGRLRASIDSGALAPACFYEQLVYLTYRVMFLFIAEERGILHPPGASACARARYQHECSTQAMRERAMVGTGGEGDGQWEALHRVCRALSARDGDAELGLTGMGSSLWSMEAARDLCGARLSDRDLLAAVRHLVDVVGRVDASGFAVLTGRQLGGVYESLLGLDARVTTDPPGLALSQARKGARKTTGSYYTPDALVEHLLDSALEPVVERALGDASSAAGVGLEAGRAARERALLSLRVCDPACGTGHFLVAASRRLAGHLARVRTGSADAGEEERLRALRDVVGACIYGVDLNPMAVELCKVSLWLACNEAGRPLSSLDAQVKAGDALLGATDADVAAGSPDSAFERVGAGEARAARRYRNRNREEREAIASALKEGGANGGAASPGADHRRLVADAWCSAFVWEKWEGDAGGDVLTEGVFRALERGPHAAPARIVDEVHRLSAAYRFFHWHLEFPDVFDRGFDVIVGNPPFLNQLDSITAAGRGAANILRAWSGGALKGLADMAAAFLLRSLSLAAPGGRVALVQPQSLLVAADVGPVRAGVLESASLRALWVSNEHAFEGASVYTCAPTLERGGPRVVPLARSEGSAFAPLSPLTIDNDALAREETWAHLAAPVGGLPEFAYSAGGSIGDRASATADFRDQYYGLDGFLVEDGESGGLEASSRDRDFPPIVTTGLIEPAECMWGRAPARILKRKWLAPRIDRERMEREGSLGEWMGARLVPKVILATQTRVLEAYVDHAGRFVPSVPLISVVPSDEGDLWRIAAAIASPVCTAIAARRYAGAALSVTAIKLSAKQVMRLPIPCNGAAWAEGADVYRAAQESAGRCERRKRLAAFGERMCEAYGVPADDAGPLLGWWLGRLGRGV